MAPEVLTDSAATAAIDAPLESIDLGDWPFTLGDAEYQLNRTRQAPLQVQNGKPDVTSAHGILTTHTVVDNVLDRFRDALGPDAACYRNHVYRGLNYQRKLLQLNVIPDEIALAWALHDIGLWTVGWDYIGPSLRHVDELAPEYGIGDVDRVRQMVELHHKVRPCQGKWVETFRVADRIDVSRGLLLNALTRSNSRASSYSTRRMPITQRRSADGAVTVLPFPTDVPTIG